MMHSWNSPQIADNTLVRGPEKRTGATHFKVAEEYAQAQRMKVSQLAAKDWELPVNSLSFYRPVVPSLQHSHRARNCMQAPSAGLRRGNKCCSIFRRPVPDSYRPDVYICWP